MITNPRLNFQLLILALIVRFIVIVLGPENIFQNFSLFVVNVYVLNLLLWEGE